MTVVSTIVLPVTYAVTKPEHNINWVYSWNGRRPLGLAPRAYLAAVMVVFPVAIFLPTHLILRGIFGAPIIASAEAGIYLTVTSLVRTSFPSMMMWRV
jgi:hypothetical protein